METAESGGFGEKESRCYRGILTTANGKKSKMQLWLLTQAMSHIQLCVCYV